MKNLRTFEQFVNESTLQLNEIKGSFTLRSKSDEWLNRIEQALKGNEFYEVDLHNKVFMKPGGKRQVAAEKFRKTIWVTAETPYFEDQGNSIVFTYDYKEFSVDKNFIKQKTKEEYLEMKLRQIFSRMYSNQYQDNTAQDDAWAAGVTAFKPADNVSPYVDSGLAVWFAKKYKINLKQWMNKQNFVWINYDRAIDYAEKYPFKK